MYHAACKVGYQPLSQSVELTADDVPGMYVIHRPWDCWWGTYTPNMFLELSINNHIVGLVHEHHTINEI